MKQNKHSSGQTIAYKRDMTFSGMWWDAVQ